MHLAEPGCLCTKAGTVSRASKAPGARLVTRDRNSQENRLSSQQVVWAPEVPPGPLLFHEKRPLICAPANARYPITAGWTGGGGGRQIEKSDGKLLEWGLNSGTSGPEPRTQPLHHTHTHTLTHNTHTCIHKSFVFK